MSNVVLVDLFTCIVLDAEKRLNLTFGYMRKNHNGKRPGSITLP